jgi:hypothetical protein
MSTGVGIRSGRKFEIESQRVAAGAGGIFVLLLFISTVINPRTPSRGASITNVTSYYVNHHTGLLLAGYLSALSILALFVFLAGLRSMLLEAEGEPGTVTSAAYTSGVVFSAIALVSTGVAITTVFKVAKLNDPVLIRALFDMTRQMLHLVYVPTAGLIGFSSLVAIGSRLFPAWLSWGGIVTALLALVVAGGLFADKSNIVTQLSLPVLLLFLAWVLSVSVLLFRRGPMI